MGFIQGILDASASTTGELANVFSTMVSPAIFSVLWLPFTILCGAGIGRLTSRLSFRTSKKMTIEAITANPDNAPKRVSDIYSKYAVDDIMGDTTSDIARDSMVRDLTKLVDAIGNSATQAERLSLPFLVLPLASWMLCAVLLGASGVGAFTGSYLACTFIVPKLEERRFILSRIEEIVRKMHYRPEDTKKISRKFYKTFRSWLKSNRSNDEIFLAANTILEEYAQQLKNP